MDKIKKALERARQDREQTDAGSVAASAPRTAVAPEESEKVVYSQTHSVPVGRSVLRDHRVVTGDEQTPLSSGFKVLRTQILQRLRENGWNTLAVTSPRAGAGKTLTAVNLSISLAREVDRTVLLVDADLRRPSIHAKFDLRPEQGLSDYLTGAVPLEAVLINPGIDKFVILPGGAPLSNSSEMLDSPRMARLVDELKSRYPSRIVVFDTPPLLESDDALAFSPYVDAALLVVEEGVSTQQEVERCVELLHGTHLIGTVLNKSRGKAGEAHAY